MYYSIHAMNVFLMKRVQKFKYTKPYQSLLLFSMGIFLFLGIRRYFVGCSGCGQTILIKILNNQRPSATFTKFILQNKMPENFYHKT